MLSVSNLSYYIGSRPIYENANLHIRPKDRIGLIGLNGTGKSTLLRLIVGEFKPDGGEISKSNDCTLGFLNQDLLSFESEESILHVAMMAFEEQNMLQKKMDEVLHEMEVNYHDDLIDKLTKLQERFEALDGYTIQSKSEEILEGLGFKTADLNRPLKTFSGGWRMRVILAKLLLQKPSLLLLDEPTNHLDLPSIQWLEDYLSNYEGGVIIVSHDREFLDNCANMIVEVSQYKLNVYAGNYEFYIEEKALRQEIQKGAFENQQAKIRQTERFIDRFKAKASKAKQVQSRVKMLKRMDVVDDILDANAKVHFKFNFGTHPGRQILTLENISKSFGDLQILNNTTARVERGDKIALIGANGKGKSTLLRIISGMEPIDGKRETGHNVKESFYAQHQLESLHIEESILDELKMSGTDKTDMELRTILGCFLFSSDDVFKKIKVLSGGERSRVALAKTLISESNFLLLDEPTNHLDMQSVNILIQALQQYEGTCILVSHDRHFVANIANKIWYIEDQEIKEYIGTYDEYEYFMEQRTLDLKAQGSKSAPAKTPAPKTEKKPVENKSKPSDEALRNQMQVQKKIKLIEEEITDLEKSVDVLNTQLAAPDLYNQPQEFERIHKLFKQEKSKLDLKQKEWENLIESIEA